MKNDWLLTIEEKNRKFGMKSDAEVLAYYVMTYLVYPPKDEEIKIDIDFMYDSILGGIYEFNDDEKTEIKQEAIKILKEKYNITL